MGMVGSISTVIVCLASTGCLAALDEDPEDSDASFVEGATEGSQQTAAAAVVVRAGALFEADVNRTRGAIELGADTRPILQHAVEGPGEVGRAALELHRALVAERGLDAVAAVLTQLLSADPSDPSGAIAAIGDGSGCADVDGFFLRDDIAETDPPLARLVLTHDASAGASCRVDGTVHYDLRITPNADGGHTLAVVAAYPTGLSIQPDTGAPVLVGAGGTLSVGLVFDAGDAVSALDATADYCTRLGADGADLCFEDTRLALTGVEVRLTGGTCATCGSRYGEAFVDGLAGSTVDVSLGTRLGLEVSGAATYGRLALALGDAATPVLFDVGFDTTDGWAAMIDGDVTTTVDDEVATYTFSPPPASAEPGFWITKPIGAPELVFDGCAARTAEETYTACFTGFGVLGGAGSREGSLSITADGAMSYETPRALATYLFTAVRAEIHGASVVLDGTVTRIVSSASLSVVFEGFEIAWSAPDFVLSGVIETQRDGATLVRADFCDGSTFTWDGDTEASTIAGCVALASPRYGTLELGGEASPMTVTLASRVSTVDGPLAYLDPAMRRIATITFEGWRAENLADETLDVDYHRRVTGRATLDVLGVRGNVASTSGVDSRVTTTDDASTVQLDGDVTVSLDVGAQSVSGDLVFTGYQAAFMEGSMIGSATLAHSGVIDMDVTLGGSSLLPSSSMRVTFGDGTDPFVTTTSETRTTMNGRVLLGVGCASGTCNEDVDVLLTDVTFATPTCGRQHPHAGTAVISGLDPSTSALVPALRVRCECNGAAGRETLLPRTVTMVFTPATPSERRIQIPEAEGVCGLRLRATCNEPGAAWLREASLCTE